ncbi:hypothetical protein DYB37_005824 [Aphanomyces astaci]|uniref:peptidyl-tRNA hydrolase n=1 Tax=Aphanomyces astaci TaxID=112090 RepID=A0A3L6VW99_APHAT|nr:hypothetical protein DYB35_005237 [Aphanomyces astaci]RHZ13678.1 hypothetical protein DYB37_005824 [Aphanomyces astaci]RLO12944.1 hypothetical protein DYB28_009040 [Aphanomyces astaci]
MDLVKWGSAFLLGIASHWYLASESRVKYTAYAGDDNTETDQANDPESHDDSDDEDESDDDCEPHKMVLVVRNDLKMTKGKIAAQCGHATLGAYKRALKRTPQALDFWEYSGQTKVALKIESEEEMLLLAGRAKELGLVHYIVVDAGRTQIAPDSKTVLAVGPAPAGTIDNLTGHLKLM